MFCIYFVLGDFVAIEEKPIDNRKGRLIRDDGDDDISDDEERVDMSAITGAKEREERRQKFYSVQQECRFCSRLILFLFVLLFFQQLFQILFSYLVFFFFYFLNFMKFV